MPLLGLYLIYQNYNNGYDTYDSAVVIADDIAEAKRIYPGDTELKYIDAINFPDSAWVSHVDNVKAIFLGCAKDGLHKGVICASYNAG